MKVLCNAVLRSFIFLLTFLIRFSLGRAYEKTVYTFLHDRNVCDFLLFEAGTWGSWRLKVGVDAFPIPHFRVEGREGKQEYSRVEISARGRTQTDK